MQTSSGKVEGLADATSLVRETWRDVLTPRERLPLDEWADRHRVIGGENAAEPGPWRTDRVPYAREVMRAISDPMVRRVSLMWGSQLSKTETICNAAMWHVHQSPMPAMWVLPNENMAGEFNRDRFLPNCRVTPAVLELMTGRAWDETALALRFLSMRIAFRGSNSRANVASWPIGLVIGDEIDEWGENALPRVEQRTKNFPNHKIVLASTPTLEDVGIHAQWQAGSRERFFVPCPYCGHYQTLSFERVRWEGGLNADPEAVKSEAWIACASCDGRIENRDKRRILPRGVWASETQRVLPGGIVVGRRRRNEHRSFQLSSLYSPWTTFGEVAAEFINNGGQATQDWVNGQLAEPWRQLGQRTNEQEILKAASRSRPVYRRGTIPGDPVLLSGAIDVQADHLYWEVRAWYWDRIGGAETRAGQRVYRGGGVLGQALVEYGRTEAPEIVDEEVYNRLRMEGGADLSAATAMESMARFEAEVMNRLFDVVDAQGKATGRSLAVWKWAIDANFRTEMVYRWAAHHAPRVVPMAGRDAKNLTKYIQATQIEQTSDGVRLGSPVELVLFDSEFFKDQAYPDLRRETPAPGAFRWPGDLDMAYARQITAEHRITKAVRGGTTTRWEKKSDGRANHWWDCYIMSHVLKTLRIQKEVMRKAAVLPAPPPRPDNLLPEPRPRG